MLAVAGAVVDLVLRHQRARRRQRVYAAAGASLGGSLLPLTEVALGGLWERPQPKQVRDVLMTRAHDVEETRFAGRNGFGGRHRPPRAEVDAILDLQVSWMRTRDRFDDSERHDRLVAALDTCVVWIEINRDLFSDMLGEFERVYPDGVDPELEAKGLVPWETDTRRSLALLVAGALRLIVAVLDEFPSHGLGVPVVSEETRRAVNLTSPRGDAITRAQRPPRKIS